MAVYAYLRVSTDRQDVRSQRHGILEYANAYQLGPRTFVEDEASGRMNWRERAVGKLLTETAQPGDVVVWAIEQDAELAALPVVKEDDRERKRRRCRCGGGHDPARASCGDTGSSCGLPGLGEEIVGDRADNLPIDADGGIVAVLAVPQHFPALLVGEVWPDFAHVGNVPLDGDVVWRIGGCV